MKSIEVTMKRSDLKNLPKYSLPEGFYFDFFKKGDESDWIHLETVTDEFPNEEKAWERFNREFGPHLEEFSKRCIFIKNKDNKIIGTTSAWYGEFEGEVIGRIHWVSILPDYQGKGLAKPLISEAIHLLSKHHKKAYLDSETKNYKAINMYLDFGFEPVIDNKENKKAWEILEEKLGKKIIE